MRSLSKCQTHRKIFKDAAAGAWWSFPTKPNFEWINRNKLRIVSIPGFQGTPSLIELHWSLFVQQKVPRVLHHVDSPAWCCLLLTQLDDHTPWYSRIPSPNSPLCVGDTNKFPISILLTWIYDYIVDLYISFQQKRWLLTVDYCELLPPVVTTRRASLGREVVTSRRASTNSTSRW